MEAAVEELTSFIGTRPACRWRSSWLISAFPRRTRGPTHRAIPPYSESQFKTMKYRPAFPDRSGSMVQARIFCREFFPWYNHDHRHSGIGLMTFATVHYGQAEAVLEKRSRLLAGAYVAHPKRFMQGHRARPTCPRPRGSTNPRHKGMLTNR